MSSTNPYVPQMTVKSNAPATLKSNAPAKKMPKPFSFSAYRPGTMEMRQKYRDGYYNQYGTDQDFYANDYVRYGENMQSDTAARQPQGTNFYYRPADSYTSTRRQPGYYGE